MFKWSLIGGLVWFEVTGKVALGITYYLLASNLFSYFYYHVWDTNREHQFRRDGRRFINWLSAVLFYIFSYAYIFTYHFHDQLDWGTLGANAKFSEALIFSFANSLSANVSELQPVTFAARLLVLSETFTTFLFVVIIIANSLPQTDAR